MEKMKLVLAILFITCISSLQAQSNSVVKIASELTLLFDPLTIEYGDTMKYKYTITNIGDQALEITGLDETLDQNGTFTVFAPNNDAFSAFLLENGFENLNAIPTETLKRYLLNHVL